MISPTLYLPVLRFVISGMLWVGLFSTSLSPAAWAGTKPHTLSVAVSIKPLHSLVSGLMVGSGYQPLLIVNGGASPHAYSLKPSDARKIGKADVIVWIGPNMEGFLEKPLRSLVDQALVITLAPESNGLSPHIWLSPIRMVNIIPRVVAGLVQADPGRADLYRRNGKKLTRRLQDLQVDLENMLRPVHTKPFLVFHDAFDHFAKAFTLTIAGVVTLNPERAPGARRIADLRKLMRGNQVSCLFAEPQLDSGRLRAIIENMENARLGVLDPLGSGIPAGKDMYFKLMRANAQALIDCL